MERNRRIVRSLTSSIFYGYQARRNLCKQAEEDAKKAAEEAEVSGSEQTGGNKVTKYAATFLGVLALVGLAAGGGIYTFMKQKQKKQAEKEALDPDANYTEDKGDFEIPTDVPDEDEAPNEQDTEPICFCSCYCFTLSISEVNR